MVRYKFLFLIGLFVLNCGKTPPHLTEFRGIWMRPPESRESLIAAIDSVQNAGINVIFLETWYHTYTIYPSKVAEQRPVFKGWDPLMVACREAHRRGIQVHAWLEVFYAFNPSKLTDLTSHLLTEHPDWKNISKDPVDHTAEDGKIFLNPAHPEVRIFLINLVHELCKNYKIDGVQLDYIRYPVDEDGKKPFGYDPLSVRRLIEEVGINPWFVTREQPNRWQAFVLWKCKQVTEVVQDLVKVAKSQDPNIKVSAAVFPDYFEDPIRERKCQDWQQWVRGDLLDFVATMCYASSDSLRQLQIEESLALSNVPVVIGYLNNSLADAETMIKYHQAALQAGALGTAWFVYHWGQPIFFQTLQRQIYVKPARPFALE